MNRVNCQNQGMQPYGVRSVNTGRCITPPQNMPRENGCMNTPYPKEHSCECAKEHPVPDRNRPAWHKQVPTGDRRQLFKYIDEVSFGAYEALLFLDTHPDCTDALQYFQEHNEKRSYALKEYARLYGPLNLMDADTGCMTYWNWVNQPWPWEGGNC